MSFRWPAIATAILAVAPFAHAQSVKLAEELKPGDHFKYDLKLTVTGRMKVERDGKPDPLPIEAEATHQFVERIESADAGGGAGKVLRHYAVAVSKSRVGSDKSVRELPADRRLTVASRTATKTLHLSPDGPLTREELDLVGEHFDTMCLPALLPGKEVKVGDTWAVPADAVQHALLFDGVLKHDLKGTLVKVENGVAEFSLSGIAEGTALGAKAIVVVTATGTFDTAAGRITSLTWEQEDDRTQGPATPAVEVKAKVVLTRAACEEPKELNAEARAKVPAEAKVAALIRLRLTSADGTFAFTYPREWVIVGQTKDHLVLRLLDKGEFVAQVTMTNWKAAEAGKHSTPDEFKDRLAKLPHWEPERVTADKEVPLDAGRWLYRVSAVGKQDGTPVVQTFYLLAGANGRQLSVAVMSAPDKAAALAAREEDLLKAITFPEKK